MKNLFLAIIGTLTLTLLSNQNVTAFSTNVEISSVEKNITPPSQIMKLKRALLRNLKSDNLIDSKKDFVRMELPERQIIINGKILEGKLLKKYENILSKHEISHGEKKAIHISPQFIKVGNFYEDCFKGTASGKMKLKFCGEEKESKKSLF